MYVIFSDPITKNEPEECCNRPPHLKNPYCNEIPVPDDDYFFGKFKVKCIDFVRSFPSVRPGCRLGKNVFMLRFLIAECCIDVIMLVFYIYRQFYISASKKKN